MHKIQFLFSSLFLSSFIINHFPVKAQITPDNTLGNESSQINSNVLIKGVNADQINGGATRGSNLFHSFSEFNIKDGQRVYFANPLGVFNILTRVTGKDKSSIFGTLGVDGNANLFLMNPNGILFGKDASLDIRGSFVGTTANALQFGNQGVFSATNPEAPPLLTINPNALVFSQQQSSAVISNQSQVPAGKDPAGVDVFGLRVTDGKSLLLVGGNVSMDGGWAIANGGHIELGGLTEPGSIGIQSNGDNFSLSFPEGVQRGDVSLNNRAIVGVPGNGGGSITVNARNLDVLNRSELFGGIGESLGSANTQAGDITVDVIGQINLAGTNSLIFNSVQSQAIGNPGNISIKTGSLEVTGGAQIDSFTRGRGNAGNITIQAKDAVTLDGKDSNGFPSAVFSNVQPGAIGNGGNINLTAGSLSLTNGGIIGVDVRGVTDDLPGGQGIGGTVDVKVRDALTISGTDSGIFGSLGEGAVGRAGNIKVQAGNLFIKDDGNIISSTFGKGDSGSISITANESLLLDVGGIYSNVQSRDAMGNAGKIDITTGSLSLTNGAQINSFTRGQGNAGDITIQAKDVISFYGFDSDGNSSGVFSNVLADAKGNAGDINLTANSMFLTNGGQLRIGVNGAYDTFAGGQGTGGTVNVNVRDALTISSTDSGIFAGTGTGAVGRGGDITIQAGKIAVENSGTITSETYGKGDAGNISINTQNLIVRDSQLGSIVHGEGNAGTFKIIASDSVDLSGEIPGNEKGFPGGILAQLDATGEGKGGNLYLETRRLSVSDGSKVQVATFGEGNAGSLFIRANEIDVFETEKPNFYSTGIFAGVQLDPRTVKPPKGNGGDLTIETKNLSLRNGGEIGSSTSGEGDSGNIFVTASDAISLDASYIYNNVQSSNTVGNAGKIDIKTGSIAIINGAQINSFTRGKGNAGNIIIQARDAVTFDGFGSNRSNSGSFSSVETGAVGNGGSINITAGSLSLTNSGTLGVSIDSASEQLPGGQGIGGDININVRDAFTIAGTDSGIDAFLGSGAIGQSGDVNIQVQNLFIKDGGGINSSTFGKGNGGNIKVEAKDLVEILGNSALSSDVQESGIGNAGDITIKTGRLIVRNSQIGPSTFGEGNAGNFKIIATDSVELSGQISKREGNTSLEGSVGFPGGLLAQIDLTGKGRGGNLTIETSRLSVSDGSKIQAATFGDGDAGNIFIRADEIDLFETEKPNFFNTGIFAGVQTDGRIDAGIIDPRGGRPPKGQGGNLTIETGKLNVRNGAEIFAATKGEGDAGKIFIRAKESVNVTGISTGTLGQRTSKITASASETSTGNAGSLTIETPLLNVANGGFISSTSEGVGNAGILTINANTIRLDNKASLNANTRSPNKDPNREQATINLNTDALILRRNSNITTNATGQNVIGGNISIDAGVIAAFENSDISANSTDFRGGRVSINTEGIFGTQARNFPTPESDITATGANPSLNGTTEINLPDVDPSKGLIELPERLSDQSDQIDQLCGRGRIPLGQFVVVGKNGSIQSNPVVNPMQGEIDFTPLATLDESNSSNRVNQIPDSLMVQNPPQNRIVEAQAIAKGADGTLYLVADPNVTPSSRSAVSACANVRR
jgi:filamentous hemagglutinin family protein